jgi:hypothetical protein
MCYHLPQQYQTVRELDLRDAICPYCLQHKEGFHLVTRTWEKHYHQPTKTKQKCKFVQKINLIHVKLILKRTIDKTLTYASETWILTKGDGELLNIFERKV